MSASIIEERKTISLNSITKPGNFVWFILGILLVTCYFSSEHFYSTRNLRNVFLIQSVGLCIATLAQVIVMLSGNIDMSIGAAVSLLTTMAAALFRDISGIDPLAVSAIMLGTGMLIGALNAFFVVALRIPSFMATLATMSLLQGIIYFYTKAPIGGIPRSFRFLASYRIHGIPLCFLYLLVIFVVLALIIRKHRFGNHLIAVGSDDYIAGLTGINVKKVKVQVYVMSGALVALAAIFLSSRMGGGGPTTGAGFELDTITAAVIGGVSLAGGQGKLLGAIGGVLILSIFSNFMNLMDINQYIQMLLKGLILILAVSFYAKKILK